MAFVYFIITATYWCDHEQSKILWQACLKQDE
jgi:hypothetical protein